MERWRRIDHDTLRVDLTFEDPKAYTKPWTGQRVFKWKPGEKIMESVSCEDRLLEGGPQP